MKTALLLVDIQNDFITGSLPVPDGAAIIDPVNSYMTDYEYVIATQDWHPATHFSFHTSHPGRKPFETIERDGESQTLWPPHCVQASDGAALHPRLDTAPIAAIFRKGIHPDIDSYSAFFDNLRRRQTGLDGYLRGLGIGRLTIAGLAADYCVYYTIKDALSLGYEVTLSERLTRPISPEDFERQKRELTAHPAFTLTD